MNLKCIHGMQGHLDEGSTYDVAEIEGHPFHVMVRLPDGSWAPPFHPLHSLHPEEYFEMPDGLIEIVSDGFECKCVELFGVELFGGDYILRDDEVFAGDDDMLDPCVETFDDVITEFGRGRVIYVGYHFNQFVRVGSTEEAKHRIVAFLDRFKCPVDASKIRYWCFEHYSPRRGESI